MRIVLTMGDPAGIGPEIIARALSEDAIQSAAEFVVVGRPQILQRAFNAMNANIAVQSLVDFGSLPSRNKHSIESQSDEASLNPSRTNERRLIYCIEAGPAAADGLAPGQLSSLGGQVAHDALVAATHAALIGTVDAMVTAPLNKLALHAAGYSWPGHTELLASLCEVEDFAMMLYLPPKEGRGGPAGLGVVHVTLHVALRDVFKLLNRDSIFEKIALAQSTFQALRTAMSLPASPALAVAALNPHSGEGGLFGDEEETIIRPAVQMGIDLGWNVRGPLSVDTLMPTAVQGTYDAVVAMYHDQGHIALKLLDMFDAVNITLGLPIIRTSVAHGTAYDIAGKGIAKSSGMVQAIMTAIRLAKFRAQHSAVE